MSVIRDVVDFNKFFGGVHDLREKFGHAWHKGHAMASDTALLEHVESNVAVIGGDKDDVVILEGEKDELPPLIPRELLFGNPEKSAVRLSSDGKRLAYLAADEKGVLNVHVRTIGKSDDHVVTSDPKRGIRGDNFAWQEDGQHILYLQDKDGDENWHIYQTNISTGKTRDLIPFENVQAQIIALDPRFPDEMLIGLNRRDPKVHDVYRVNLKDGTLQLDTVNPGDVVTWEADNTFQVRAAQAILPNGDIEIRVRDNSGSSDKAGPSWSPLMKWGVEENDGGIVGFTPDDRGLWIESSLGANASRLLEVDIDTGKRKVLAEDKQYDAGGVLIHPEKRTLQAVEFTRDRGEWTPLDPSIKSDLEAVKKVRDGDFQVVSRDLKDQKWVVASAVSDGPVTYYLYDHQKKKAEKLFSSQPALEEYRLAKMEPFSFRARDGLTIHGYVTLPPGMRPKNLPTIIYVHGGPQHRDTWGYEPVVQWMANRGYAVIQVNYRGSTGYGKDFVNAGNHEWGGKMHDDLLDAKQWAIKHGYTNPQKTAILGGSYGGYATLVGVSFTPKEFVCGVDIVGPSNLVTLLKNIPPYWEPARSMLNVRWGNPDTEEEFLKSRSPLFKADQIEVPLLIGQGANDPRVNKGESDQIVAAMRKNGQEVEYLVFPDEGHGFRRPENRKKFYAFAEQFLAKHLGGRSEPASEKESVDGIKQ